jgi:hypothetical protein
VGSIAIARASSPREVSRYVSPPSVVFQIPKEIATYTVADVAGSTATSAMTGSRGARDALLTQLSPPSWVSSSPPFRVAT